MNLIFSLSSQILVGSFLLFSPLLNADSASDFAFFQSLKGTWGISESGRHLPIKMTYDLGSRNSIVTEQFGKELSVFFVDNTDLLMTHFCNRGNQPRLKLAVGMTPNIYRFDLIDIANLKDPAEPHVHRIIYRVIDSTHIDLEIVWQTGAVQASENYSLVKE